MPLIGSRCENRWWECVPAEECIACSASPSPERGRCALTTELLEAIFHGGDDRRDAGLSATMLTGPCLCKSYLETTQDYYEFPSRRWPAVRGTLLHLLYERASPREAIIREQRFARRVDDQTVVTGKIDKVDLRQGLIVDAKTKEELPKSVDDMPGYIYQLNTYRWILADGWNVKTGQPVRVPITSLGLVVHTMTSFRKYAVPVLPEPEFLAWFLPRAQALAEAFHTGQWPERGLNPEASNFCASWCPVRDSCLAPSSAGDRP